ncbi:MAG: TonB-dependent receptor family protein [Muribaculaceae bacterium]|nr:TonB-dependent receptor family protein [Muribaculaceae bacterium]
MTKRLIIVFWVGISCLSLLAQESTQEQDSLYNNQMVELMEVVVKGYFPNTRLKGNALVTRIEGTDLATTGTVGEMLIKVPGMTGSEDAPEVLGKGSPLIYINGRLMRDDSELKRLRSEDIRDVEVINNPGAQYDATVRAVVRIRTIKQQGEGLGVDLTLTSEQDLRYGFNRPSGKLGLNYRINSVDVFGSVYYFHQDYRQYSDLEEITKTNKIFRQNGPYTMTWKNNQLTYTAGVNWQISDNHSVGLRADLTHYLGGTNMVIYDEDVFENGALIDHLYSEQTSKESKPLGLLTNTYYSGIVGKLSIDFNFDFMKSEINTDRENIETSLINDDFVLSKSGSNSHLYATKLVLSYPVWKGKIEGGTEMTFAKRHNTYWIDKASIANTDADITENNIAAFAEYSLDFERYGQASVGLRYEHTLYDYDDQTNNDFLHRSMDEFFPTAAYSVTIGNVNAGLSYSIKTNRPSFFAMNDAVTYISRYSMQAGNSQLLNERLRDLTLNVSWRWLAFTATYERCKNAITQWSFITDDDAALIKHINLDKPIKTYSVFVSATPRMGIWSLNATAGVAKQDFFLDIEGPDGTRRDYYNKPMYTLNAFNTFSLRHNWRFDINFMFRSRGHMQNFYCDCDNIKLGFVAQKSFLKDNALTIKASVLDVLQRNHFNEYADMGYYQIQQNNRYSTHKFVLSLNYRFNTTRSKYKGTGAGKDAQQRMKN